MGTSVNEFESSKARQKRREQIVDIAKCLVGQSAPDDFDPIHSSLCAIDIVIVCGAPWLKECLEKDYLKDESGYKKIGGGANTPKKAYFYRSVANFIHFFKRQGLYVPRGGMPHPCAGMACFFDWDDRGRFNFTPDRCGIIAQTDELRITKVILPFNEENSYIVKLMDVEPNSLLEKAIIGYSDLP